MPTNWISERMRSIELSGIRRVFDLARSLKDPVDLSIGQPHFDVPDPIKSAAKAAIDRGANGYTPSAGVPELRERLQAEVNAKYPGQERAVLVTSGTGGGLLLSLMCSVNPGDEVIAFDPYFVMYPHQVTLCGGKVVGLRTHPPIPLHPN